MDCITRTSNHSGYESWRGDIANRNSVHVAIPQENNVMSTNHEARFKRGLFASNSRFAELKTFWLDLVFPPMCHGCGRVDTLWCDDCLDALNQIPLQLQNNNSEFLMGLCSTGKHQEKLQQAIQAFKFYNAKNLAAPLSNRLISALAQKQWTFDIIIPVPLHTDREKNRGYNQAYLLSQQVAQYMNITCQPDYLTRYQNTPHQVGLNASERRENVKDAFLATEDVAGQSILLIDDVVTTGATLDECAKALFKADATTVYAVTVSHA